MRCLLIALALLFAAPFAAQASDGPWGLTPAGDPLLTASPDSSAQATQWWACPPADQCRIVAGDARFEPGATARGTVFEVNLTWPFERSPMWMGRVAALNHPRLLGTLRTGQKVWPVGALWVGGWVDDMTTSVVVACPASQRAQCEYLNGPGAATTGSGPRELLAKYVGWYVYAIQYRTPHDSAAPSFPAGPAPRPVASALVAVSERRGPIKRARRTS